MLIAELTTAPRTFSRSNWLNSAPTVPLILWGCMWLNLNTGFWNIAPARSIGGLLTAIRALLPFAVLPCSLVMILVKPRKSADLGSNPLLLLTFYGLVCTISSLFSPHPWWSAYWALTFLCTVFTARTFSSSKVPLATTEVMLQVTWVITFIVAAIIAYTVRNVVFSTSGTGYGVDYDLKGLSRSSGVARWAAVPALVFLLKAYHANKPWLVAGFLGIAGIALFIVYRMQSRGAVFGVLAAILFALLCVKRMRRYALPIVIFLLLATGVEGRTGAFLRLFSVYIARGQSEETLRSMTGRTRAYQHGWRAFEDAPIMGRGNWTDRLIIGEHVHNSYLQALLNAGILGFLPYLGSWIVSWTLFWKLFQLRRMIPLKSRNFLLETGTVMMFFTLRSSPETTTASFAVDLLVMSAIYIHLEMLWLRFRPLKKITHRQAQFDIQEKPVYLPAY